MAFSQFIRVAKGKVDATPQKASHLSTDLSYGGDKNCFDLGWQNGQIMMQGQSSRARKGPIRNGSPTFISKPEDGKDPYNSKVSKFSTMDFVLNDFPLCDPSYEMGLDQEDDFVPWLNSIEPLNSDYCSEFLPELGVAGNEHSTGNNLASMEKRSNSGHVTAYARSSFAASAPNVRQESTSNALSSVTQLTKHRISEISPSKQSQHTLPRPGNSDKTHNDAGNANHIDSRISARCSSAMGGSMGIKLHKYDEGQAYSSGIMNFPYFSRFASLSGVNVQNTPTTTVTVCSSVQRVSDKVKGSANNHMEPILVNCSRQESGSHVELSVPPSARGIKSVTLKQDSVPPQQSEAICQKDGKEGESLGQAFSAVPSKVVAVDEKIPEPEPAPAASSVCSGNILERASNDPACSLKRKSHEMGDSDGPTDEVEEESVGGRKTAPGCAGSKRGRAAEVHNLSERRRRDRINEKMRALQELIPNCNKADKASMLDEAIEYLKNLQLQVQILSMGAGMLMPPVMLQTAMQQMHRVHMPQFLPMGMGMGLGIGMHDLNYGMTQMPNIQGACYSVPRPPMSTSSTFHGAVGSSHQNLGPPDQELLMSMPHVPLSYLGNSSMRLSVGNSAMPSIVDPPPLAPSTSSKEMIQNVDSRVIFKNQANDSMSKESDQASILLNDRYRAVNADEAQNPGGTRPT